MSFFGYNMLYQLMCYYQPLINYKHFNVGTAYNRTLYNTYILFHTLQIKATCQILPQQKTQIFSPVAELIMLVTLAMLQKG